jgi:hypothetical protein
MIALEYVVARWTDGSLTITGWGVFLALLFIFTFAVWRSAS